MTDAISLLPPNATDQERAIELSTARLADIPILVREAWNPDDCPAALLPWLAWAFSVDEWQPDWTEAEQRAVIKNALLIHKHKGTLAALRRAVAPLGYIIRIVEWYEDDPIATPYTFRLEVGVTDKGVDEAIYTKLTRLIETYKNVRSYMVALTLKVEVKGFAYLRTATMSGVDTTVYPWFPEDMESDGGAFWASFVQSVDTVSIYPN